MAENLDVAVFVPGLLGGGGAEKTALCLATALRDSGLTVACFTDAHVEAESLGAHFGMDLHSITFPVLPAPTRSRRRVPVALLDAWDDRRRLRAVRRSRPTLFVNMKFKSSLPGAGKSNWYFVHFPHPLAVPSRSRLHGAYLAAVALLRRFLLHPRSRRFIDSYDIVTANSDFTGRHIARRWGVGAETLYPPCNVSAGRDADRPRDRIILGVGRFQSYEPGVPHKNQHVMVEALAGLTDLIAEGWELHLVGTSHGPGAEAYLQEIRTQAEGLPVVFHSNASAAELADLHSRASIYWHAQGYGTKADEHPEAQEHFGISTVEAMAAGAIPLVYTSAGPLEVVAPVDQRLPWATISDLLASTRAIASAADTSACRAACAARAQDFSEAAFRVHVNDIRARLDDSSVRASR